MQHKEGGPCQTADNKLRLQNIASILFVLGNYQYCCRFRPPAIGVAVANKQGPSFWMFKKQMRRYIGNKSLRFLFGVLGHVA